MPPGPCVGNSGAKGILLKQPMLGNSSGFTSSNEMIFLIIKRHGTVHILYQLPTAERMW